MTFCLAMRVRDGLVGIADTRVVSGSETITAKKVITMNQGDRPFFLMTSGLRSLRDKTLTYFRDALETLEEPKGRLYQVANLFADQLRRAAAEDRESLEASGFTLNLHALIGGQLHGDPEHKLYLIYPQANWVEIGPGTPYHIIGASGYGKPVLDRTLKFEDTLKFAMKVGCLAFDSTRISAADVDLPVDVVVYDAARHQLIERRYDKEELAEMSNWWQERLRDSVRALPAEALDRLLDEAADDPASNSILAAAADPSA